MKKFCIMILLIQTMELSWIKKLQSAMVDSQSLADRYFRFNSASEKGSKQVMSSEVKKFEHPFKNPDLDIEARIKNLLSLMAVY